MRTCRYRNYSYTSPSDRKSTTKKNRRFKSPKKYKLYKGGEGPDDVYLEETTLLNERKQLLLKKTQESAKLSADRLQLIKQIKDINNQIKEKRDKIQEINKQIEDKNKSIEDVDKKIETIERLNIRSPEFKTECENEHSGWFNGWIN